MKRRLPFALSLLLVQTVAWGQDVTPIASHTLVSVRRTLHTFPFKGVITGEKGWRRVTKGLADPPPQPDFAKTVCALVVADLSGEAESWVTGVTGNGTELGVTLLRREAKRPSLNPKLRAFFLVVPRTYTGVRLSHKTQLSRGGGVIERAVAALPTDGDGRLLPRLGPDLRLSFTMADGSVPPSGIMLRYEAVYPKQGPRGVARTGRKQTIAFPAEGLPFPRIRDEVRHLYAAFAPGLRSTNPLTIRRLPRKGPDGSPLPIRHTFKLEPVPR